jgi:hypothetical protein
MWSFRRLVPFGFEGSGRSWLRPQHDMLFLGTELTPIRLGVGASVQHSFQLLPECLKLFAAVSLNGAAAAFEGLYPVQ